MKNQFVSYTRQQIANLGDQHQNIAFEMMARCISDGTRIIIEQGEMDGDKYLMVDFCPTDKSNPECETSGNQVCFVTSADGEDCGDIDEEFTNYIDACKWLANFLEFDDYTKAYIETY